MNNDSSIHMNECNKRSWTPPRKLMALNSYAQLQGKDFALSVEGTVTTGGTPGYDTPAGPS